MVFSANAPDPVIVCEPVCVGGRGRGLGMGAWRGKGEIELLEVSQRPVRDRGQGQRQEKQPVLSRKFTELIKVLKHKTHTCTRKEK